MVRQTPFCTPNAHITQVYFLSTTNCCVSRYLVWVGHHFLWWALNISLSLSASFQCTQRGMTRHTNRTHSNRKEQMKSSGEAVKSWRAMLSRASVDSITQSPVHRPDTFTSRLRLYLVTTGQEAWESVVALDVNGLLLGC